MCLKSFKVNPTLSDKKIKVFKVLIYNSPYKIFHTPTIRMDVPKIPCTLTAHGELSIEETHFGVNVGEGYIHAYRSYSRAKAQCDIIYETCIIVSGYIPKSTYYYTGINKDICAREIKLTEIIYLQKSIIDSFVLTPVEDILFSKYHAYKVSHKNFFRRLINYIENKISE